MARGNRAKRRRRGVTIRDRFRRLPNSLLLYVTFALAVGAAVLATFPFEVPATQPVPKSEADRVQEAAAARGTALSTTTSVFPPEGTVPGTTTTTILVGLETQPRVSDGFLECASPVFELTVPSRDQRVAKNDDCADGARFRLTLAAIAGGSAILIGITARRVRLKRYERIARVEKVRVRDRMPRKPSSPGA